VTTIPRGLGIYCERGDSVAGAAATSRLVERLQRAGAKHVGLCAEASDGWRPRRAAFARVVEQLVGAGLDVHAYALPGHDRAKLGARVTEELLTLSQRLPLRGYILDAEEPYRGLHDELVAAWSTLVDGATEATMVGLTTYGLPTERGAFPWKAIVGRGWLGWQAYLRAAKAARVRAGLEVLRGLWDDASVVPHLASYERKGAPVAGELDDGPGRLVSDLDRACRDDEGRIDVLGAWVWAEGSLSSRELDALGNWVSAAGW